MSGTRPSPLRGVTPIVATAYDDQERPALDDVVRQVEHLVGLDVAAIGVGFGSDILRLTDRERDALVATVAAASAGRRPVMAGVGGNSTAAIVERAIATRRAGADILMVTPPGSLASPTPEVIVETYRRVGRETGAPLVVQDAPGFTGVALSPDLLARIAVEVPEVCALKIEAVPPAPKVGRVVALDHAGVAVLGGAGGLDFWHELERGADGTVPGVAMTELFLLVHALHGRGDVDRGRALFNRHLPLLALASRDMDTFFAVQHQMLATRGITRASRPRRPSVVDPGLAAEVTVLLADLGITTAAWELVPA